MKLTYQQVMNLKKGDLVRGWKDGAWVTGQIHSTESGYVPAVFIKEKNGNIERFNTGTNFVEEFWVKVSVLNIEYQETQTEQFSIFDKFGRLVDNDTN